MSLMQTKRSLKLQMLGNLAWMHCECPTCRAKPGKMCRSWPTIARHLPDHLWGCVPPQWDEHYSRIVRYMVSCDAD